MAVANDKTTNKVAVCSAIFAGFAYVGYSVVRTAFSRKLVGISGKGHSDDEDVETRVYFRRLSQSLEYDSLLGTENSNIENPHRLFLRPKGVRDRIRELNLRACHFAETILAIQRGEEVPKFSVHGLQSLQCSPWNSPRVLSPVDICQLSTSQSVENLSLDPDEVHNLVLHRRWSQYSLKRKKKLASLENGKVGDKLTVEATSQDRQMIERLKALPEQNRLLTMNEAKSLTTLLHVDDLVLLEKVVTTIGNFATLSQNQELLRESGALPQLQRLLTHTDRKVCLSAVQALGNLALNQLNQKEMKTVIPILLMLLETDIPDNHKVSVLITLTNLTVFEDWHQEFCSVLPGLYRLTATEHHDTRLQVWRLLVNLSINLDMVAPLLKQTALPNLHDLISRDTVEDILLRVVTFLANVMRGYVKLESLGTCQFQEIDESSLWTALFSDSYRPNLQKKVNRLLRHSGEDVRVQARRIIDSLQMLGELRESTN